MIQTASDSFMLPASLPLEEGGLLFNAVLAYEAYGRPAPENAVVLLHDLAHSHKALGPAEDAPYQPSGWGGALVGEGKVLDPQNQWVLAPNLLGSPFGSTSPVSLDPENGKPLGPIFPPLTMDDQARAVAGFLRGMEIKKARALVGVGFGGMVALRLAALFPGVTAGVVALGSGRTLPERLRERLSAVPQILSSDPTFEEGAYEAGQGPRGTIKALRLEYLRLTSTREALLARYQDPLAAERGLDAEAEAFAGAFDANCYSLLCGAYGRADVGPHFSKIAARVMLVSASSSAVAPPAHVRDTYRLLSAGGANARAFELKTELGQDGLLADAEQLKGPVGAFLATLDRPR
ncbi:MAG TPA: alpha/beta fold hydrolase [Myxococcaceae bacterium]|nr:alpha/beta fold hydrolase [Myxococcaceae bacterium]